MCYFLQLNNKDKSIKTNPPGDSVHKRNKRTEDLTGNWYETFCCKYISLQPGLFAGTDFHCCRSLRRVEENQYSILWTHTLACKNTPIWYSSVLQSAIWKNEGSTKAEQCMRQCGFLQAHNGTLMFAVCAKCVICCMSNHVIVFSFPPCWRWHLRKPSLPTHSCLSEIEYSGILHPFPTLETMVL